MPTLRQSTFAMTVNADHGQTAQRSYGPGDPCSCDRERFGEYIPLIRRQDVKGFITRKPLWLATNLPVAMIRREAEIMEDEARNFYQVAIAQTSDAAVRQLLGELAAEETKHYGLAEKMDEQQKASGATNKESESERHHHQLERSPIRRCEHDGPCRHQQRWWTYEFQRHWFGRKLHFLRTLALPVATSVG